MRNYATLNPEYAKMPHWRGNETADIVYHDKSRSLTKILITGGHLKLRNFSGQRPRYFIEVKATRYHFEKDFYISGAQYRMVR